MKVALITVNFNGAEKTIELLESLRSQTDLDFEMIVVDNSSGAEDILKLESYISSGQNFKLIKNSANLGFSGGNNVGIKKVLAEGFEWIVLINNDTHVESQFIFQLKTFASKHIGEIIALPTNEGDRTAYCGIVEWLKPTLPHQYKSIDNNYLQEKGYVIGAGLGIHKSVFERIGFLDERYFLYFEDADFSMRAKQTGITIDIASVAIHHSVSSTTKKLGSPLLLRYHYRNAHLFNWKNGPTWIKLILPFWSLYISIKQIIKIILRINLEQSKAILKGILDFYFNRMGKIKV